jgi:hypothetical protein
VLFLESFICRLIPSKERTSAQRRKNYPPAVAPATSSPLAPATSSHLAPATSSHLAPVLKNGPGSNPACGRSEAQHELVGGTRGAVAPPWPWQMDKKDVVASPWDCCHSHPLRAATTELARSQRGRVGGGAVCLNQRRCGCTHRARVPRARWQSAACSESCRQVPGGY